MAPDAQDVAPSKRSAMSQLAAAAALMRPEQWIKNGFILIPVFFSGRVDWPIVGNALLGALAFSAFSSAIYIFNDICDVEDDKQHAKKRLRPLPSGQISVPAAIALAVALFAVSVAIVFAAGLPARLFLIGGIYAAINLAYSLGMKHVPVLELFMVAAGYILRLLAGSVIDAEALSPWIIVCTGLVSLMLVVGKRRGDVANALDESGRRKSLRHYTLAYLDQLTTILAAATFVTYLLFCISDYGMIRFGTNVPITAIFVLFGIFRFLQIVSVQAGGDSPTDLILRDGPLRTSILLWLLTFAVIIYA
jgi:4-hydroxybenzoate polyprenyltransferase